MSGGTFSPYRIAIRAEGAMVNAYLAKLDTMDGAIPVGSIARSICEADRSVFDAFQSLMEKAAGALTVAVLGVAPIDFKREAAPEHENAGHA